MIGKKGNVLFAIGFVELAAFIVLDKILEVTGDAIALTGYLVGVVLLVIGLILNRRGV